MTHFSFLCNSFLLVALVKKREVDVSGFGAMLIDGLARNPNGLGIETTFAELEAPATFSFRRHHLLGTFSLAEELNLSERGTSGGTDVVIHVLLLVGWLMIASYQRRDLLETLLLIEFIVISEVDDVLDLKI